MRGQSGPRVLLIEDEPLIAMSMEDALQYGGYRVDTAFSGVGALEYLDHQAGFAALVTDIRLGQGPNGWEVARHAREKKPGIPVVYVSGDCAHDFTRLGVPGSTMLQKPFRIQDLLTALKKAMDSSGARH